jgi:hypothetical protein
MSVTLEKLHITGFIEWDNFVDRSINGNFLHKRSFYNANPLNNLEDYSLIFRKNGKVIALLPGIIQSKNNQRIFNSHGRSTYGGFVIDRSVGIEESCQIIELLVTKMQELEVSNIIIRAPFRILYNQISDEMDYALWYNHFQLVDRQLEIYVDLLQPLEHIQSNYDNGTKYNIKKALKFVVTKKAELIELDNFWPILETNLIHKHKKKPVHSLEEFKELIKQCGEQNFQFHGVYLNGKLIAGCVLFVLRNKTLHAQYIAQDDTYQQYRGLSALMDHIIKWGNKNNFVYFNMGTANEGGRFINKGLFHFKESFFGRGVLRETYELNLT